MGTCRSLLQTEGCEGLGMQCRKQVCYGHSSPWERPVMLCSLITQNIALSFPAAAKSHWTLRVDLHMGFRQFHADLSFLPDHRAHQSDFLRCLLQFGSRWTEVESSQWIRMRIQSGYLGITILWVFCKWQQGWRKAAATFVMVFVFI